MKKVLNLLLLAASIAMLSSCERINVGNVGLKVNLTGDERGLSKMEYTTGIVWFTPGVSTVVEYSTRFKTVTYPESPVGLKGGTQFEAHPIITYRVNPTKADRTFTAFGTDDMELIENGYLLNSVSKALGDVANRFTPDSMLYSRELYENLVMKDIMRQCDSIGIDIQMVRANLTPPQSLTEAINLKNAAVQEAQTIQNQVLKVKAQADKDIAKARGDSASLVINAAGKARAYFLEQQQLTPLLVQKQTIDKWDGRLPVYGTVPTLFKDITKQ